MSSEAQPVPISTPAATITVYAGARNPRPTDAQSLPWTVLANELALLANEPTRAPAGADREEQKRQCIAWSPHRLRPGTTRAAKNVEAVTLSTLDIDAGATPEEIAAHLTEQGYAYLIYESPSSTPETPKFRVVCPLERELAPAECGPLRLAFAEWLGLGPGCGVEGALDPSRIFFAGKLHDTPNRRVWRDDGDPLPASWPEPRLAWGAATAPKPPAALSPANANALSVELRRAVAELPHWTECGGNKFNICGAVGGSMRKLSFFSREQCAAVIRAWLPANERGVDVEHGVSWACAAWDKPAEDVSGHGVLTALLPNRAAAFEHALQLATPFARWSAERAAANAPSASTPRPVDYGDPLGRDADLSTAIEPLRYLCAALGIAWAGKVVGVHGYAGSSKGLFLSLLALGTASGKPVLGHDAERVPVLYLDAETGPLAEIRIKRLAAGLGVDVGALQRENWFRFVHVERSLLDILPTVESASVALDKGSGVVIACDSYSSMTPGEEISSAYADGLWRLGQLGTRIGALPIVTLHERKSPGPGNAKPNPLEGISGTNRLAAALATSIRLTPDEENDRRILVAATRAPERRFAPFHMTWTDGRGDALTAVCEAAHVATTRDKALARDLERQAKKRATVERRADSIEAWLRDHSHKHHSVADVRKACALSGDNWTEAYELCRKRGTVKTEALGNNKIELSAVTALEAFENKAPALAALAAGGEPV